MKCFTSKSDWLHCFTQPKQNLTWLRRRLIFRLLDTEWVTALHKNSGIYLAYSPLLSITLFWFPRSQCLSCTTQAVTLKTPAFNHAFPGNSAEEDSHVFAEQTTRLSTCTQDCLPTIVCIHKSFNAAHRVSTIRSKPDVLTVVCSIFCPTITDKIYSMLTQLKLIPTLEVFLPSPIYGGWNG